MRILPQPWSFHVAVNVAFRTAPLCVYHGCTSCPLKLELIEGKEMLVLAPPPLTREGFGIFGVLESVVSGLKGGC